MFTYIYINLKSDKLSSNFLCYFLWVFSGFWLWLCTHSASSARFRLAINDLFFFIISISSHTINIHSSKFYIYYSSRKMSFFSYVVCFLAFLCACLGCVCFALSPPLFFGSRTPPKRSTMRDIFQFVRCVYKFIMWISSYFSALLPCVSFFSLFTPKKGKYQISAFK